MNEKKRNILTGMAIGISLAIILITVFFLGIFIGRHNNRLFPYWYNNQAYPNNRLNEHGVLGTIQTLGKNTLVIKDKIGMLKTILTDSNTKIRKESMVINFTDLKIDDWVIILGERQKEEDTIKAKIIRVIDHLQKEVIK